jgi:hypothetical protein
MSPSISDTAPAQKPRVVIERSPLAEGNANIHRGAHYLSDGPRMTACANRAGS